MTILGQHTVTETKQLIALFQARIDDLQNAWDANGQTWHDNDGGVADQWSLDFSDFKSNWEKAVALTLGIDIAQGTVVSMATLGPILGNFISTDAVTPDESGYKRIIAANYWPGQLDSVDPKNINGLDQRLTAGIGPFQRRVQPAQNAEDFDLDFISGTAPITAPVDAAAAFTKNVGKVIQKNPYTTFGIIAGIGGLILTLIGLGPYIEAKVIKKIL